MGSSLAGGWRLAASSSLLVIGIFGPSYMLDAALQDQPLTAVTIQGSAAPPAQPAQADIPPTGPSDPSATPTAAPPAGVTQTLSTEAPSAEEGATATLQPYLQSDLRVLTGNVQRPNGLAWHDGYLYTACAGDWTVYRLDDETGATTTYIFGVRNAHSLYVEDGPTIWAVDFQEDRLVSINEDTGLVPVAENLAGPWGMAAAPDSSFYISNLRDNNLVNVTREGETRVIGSGFRSPTGLALHGSTLFVANNGSSARSIEWIDVNEIGAGLLEEGDPGIRLLISGLQNVTGLAYGPDDKLYFAYSLGARGLIGRVDPARCQAAGGCANTEVEVVLWSELPAPLAGLTITPQMRLYVHTMFGREVYWLQLDQARGQSPASATAN